MVGRSHGFFARTSLVSWRTTTTKLNIYSIVCQVPTPSSATSATSRRWPWTVWCAPSTTPSVLRPQSTSRSMAGQIFPRWRTPSSLTRWAIKKWLSLLYFSSFRWAGCSLCSRSWGRGRGVYWDELATEPGAMSWIQLPELGSKTPEATL